MSGRWVVRCPCNICASHKENHYIDQHGNPSADYRGAHVFTDLGEARKAVKKAPGWFKAYRRVPATAKRARMGT